MIAFSMTGEVSSPGWDVTVVFGLSPLRRLCGTAPGRQGKLQGHFGSLGVVQGPSPCHLAPQIYRRCWLVFPKVLQQGAPAAESRRKSVCLEAAPRLGGLGPGSQTCKQ